MKHKLIDLLQSAAVVLMDDEEAESETLPYFGNPDRIRVEADTANEFPISTEVELRGGYAVATSLKGKEVEFQFYMLRKMEDGDVRETC